MVGRVAAFPVLAMVAATGCSSLMGGTPVASVDVADRVTDDVVAAVGIEPDTREVLERSNNQVNTLADTVMSRWEDFPDDDSIPTWAAALRQAGLTVQDETVSIPDGRPNSGEPDWPEVRACLRGAAQPVGARVSLGKVGTRVAVALEVGGPPASAGC